ncbi:MAG: DUF5686 family protein [Flavobacteriales bacterium]
MNKVSVLFSLFILCFGPLHAQKTIIQGRVYTLDTGVPLAGIKVSFLTVKNTVLTDSLGNYRIETYYPVDSIQFSGFNFLTEKRKVIEGIEQRLDVPLKPYERELRAIVIIPPEEPLSTRIHKRIIAHKPVNNKERLQAYQYEAYNKIQVDINNIGDEIKKNPILKKLEVVLDYLDTLDAGQQTLPAVLSESVSDFYYANKPKRKREMVKATRITGVENLQAAQFLGDMYLDINIYENVIDLFGKSFISPIANYARSVYKFYVEDSAYVNNKFCYKMRFVPKREGGLTFSGEMWVHDTTYAIQSIKASIGSNANLNYIQDLFFEQTFDQILPEVWMMTKERLILDIRLTEKTKVYGFFAKKSSYRDHFVINDLKSDAFYNANDAVEFEEGAKAKTDADWEALRDVSLNQTERGIEEMMDTLNEIKRFSNLRKLTYFASTGYFPYKKVEIGNATSLVSTNPIEKLRFSFALRTSNAFSKRLEIGGKVGYGIADERVKYSALIRYNITPKKRGMLSAYLMYDLEQIGQSPTAAQLGSTFATVFNTAPFDKLTFIKKVGINLEKDIKKDIILTTGFDWKEYTPLGASTYLKNNSLTGGIDTLKFIRTAEFIGKIRWTKQEEFLSGQFDRTSVGSPYPIISIQGIFGVKGIGGSLYNYQKLEVQLEHYTQLGLLGRLRYGFSAGYVFGNTAFPFLKAHEGNQSYWLLLTAYNKMNFLEFISDKYISGFMENHWGSIFFGQIPLIKKLNLRFVTTQKVLLGSLSNRHANNVLIPSYVKSFNQIPYVEVSFGFENILKIVRVECVWRVTHPVPNSSPLGIRARFAFNF